MEARLSIRNLRGSPTYQNSDTVVATVHLPRIVELLSIEMKLICQIVVENRYSDMLIGRHLFGPSSGTTYQQCSFPAVALLHDTYHGEGFEDGELASIRYLLQVTVKTASEGNVFKEREFLVLNRIVDPSLDMNGPVFIESHFDYGGRLQDVKLRLDREQYPIHGTITGDLLLSFELCPKFVRLSLVHRIYVCRSLGDGFVGKSQKTDAVFEVSCEDFLPRKRYTRKVEIKLDSPYLVPTYDKAYGRISVRYFVKLEFILPDGSGGDILGVDAVFGFDEVEVILYRSMTD